MKHKTVIICSILVLFLLTVQNSISVPKRNSDPTFSDVAVTTSNSHLILFGMLENAITDEMIQGLHSGIPILFSFFVELNQTSEGWNSNNMASIHTRHILSFDTLKETYKVEIEESSKRIFAFESLTEAQKVLTEINGMKVVELQKLLPDVSYSLRIRAELYKKTLPMRLHEIVPFISWWDIKTKWHNLTFKI